MMVFVRFLEELKIPKTFRNQLTFKTEKILVLYFDPRVTQVTHIILATVWSRSFFFLYSINTFEVISAVSNFKANKRIIAVCIATQL